MGGFIGLVILLAAVAFPFVMMPLLWRRMKRVQHQTNDARPATPQAPAWEEPLEATGDVTLTRRHAPNDDLIRQGDRAHHPRWPLNNE